MSKQIGDKLDVYRAYLLDDKPLASLQMQMLEKYYFAWSQLCAGYSRQKTLTALTKKFGTSMPQNYAIIRDAMALLGNVQQASREAKLSMQVDRLRQLSKKAEKKGDFKASVRAEVEAAKLEQLYDPKQTLIDPKKFLRPGAILFVSDPGVLQQPDETEDTDHEELD